MLAQRRKIPGGIAFVALIALALLAAHRVARADIDLNQFFAKVASNSSSGPAYDDPPPSPGPYFGESGYESDFEGAPSPRYAYRDRAARQPIPPPNNDANDGTMGYRAGGSAYPARSYATGRTAMRNNNGGPQSQTPMMPGRSAVSIQSHGASRGAPSARMSQNPNAPVVTPDRVYLDGTAPPGMMGQYGPMPNQSVMQGSPMMEDGPMMEGGPPPTCCNRGPDGFTNPYCNDCEACGGGCGGGCGRLPHWEPCSPCGNWWWARDLTVFVGAQNFESPVDLGVNSNFGFTEGLNWGVPIFPGIGINGQFGVAVTQNDFNDNPLSDSTRTQTFLTTGLFHRPPCREGLQYGLVFDWVRDEYYEAFNVGQLRGELSWLCDCRNEIGFHFAVGVKDDSVPSGTQDSVFEFSPIDQYTLFYRRRFCSGGEGRVWGGAATGVSGGLFGVDFHLPIAKAWSVETGFNYLFAGNDHSVSFSRDTWNIGLNLVWSIGCDARGCSPSRPLFNVADNGSFMVSALRATGAQ